MRQSKPRKYTFREIIDGINADTSVYNGRNLNGQWLFKEWNEAEDTRSIQDWRKIFVETFDITELSGSKALGFTWAEWKDFKFRWQFFTNKILSDWLEEIEVNLRSKGLQALITKSAAFDGAQAAKWLAESKWKDIRGKKEKEKDAKIRVKVLGNIANDDDELDKVFGSVSTNRTN